MKRILILLLLFAMPAEAREIFADRATYLQEQNKVNFYDNIKLVLDNATLYANRLELTLTPGKKFEINSLRAYQNLRVVEGQETITADNAIYNKADNAVILEGNVQIKSAKGTLAAEQYRYELLSKRGVISTDRPTNRVKIQLN